MTQTKRPERMAIVTGILAGALALGLLVLAVSTGSSHAAFQVNRPAADYAALLVSRAPFLRVELGLDFVFLCTYTAFFASVYACLREWEGAARDLAAVWLGAMLLSALLDAVENAHILSMLALAEQGMAIPQSEIVAQATASQLKLVLNYAGLFTLSFALPEAARLERVVGYFLRWVQGPLGVAILVVPLAWARPIALTRTTGLIFGLWALAWIARGRSRALDPRT